MKMLRALTGLGPMLALTLILALSLTGCAGYRTSASQDAPLVLPEGHRALHITGVTNPTMNPGLDPKLRTEVRDELTRRAQVEWVSRKDATALVELSIYRFTSTTSLTDSDDNTIKSSATAQVSMRITRRVDGSLLWESGNVGASESYVTDRESAESRVLNLAVRRLVDKLSQKY